MISRLVLVLTLAAMMVCAVATWYVLGTPRRTRWDLAAATPNSAEDIGQSDSTRSIEFALPSDVVAELPGVRLSGDVLDPGNEDPLIGQSVEVLASTDSGNNSAEPAALEVPSAIASLPRLDPLAAPNQPASLVVSANQVESARPDEDRPHETIELMRKLHDPEMAKQAELRLRKLGFRPEHIQLARQFTDPDPTARAAAVRSLPGARGIVARDWFLWASDDDHPQVRRMAATLMATSSNPELLRRLEALAIEDSDEEVRLVARRAIQR